MNITISEIQSAKEIDSFLENVFRKDPARLIFIFGGQGVPYIEEFKSLRARFETKEFLERSEEVIQEEWRLIKDEVSDKIPDDFQFDDTFYYGDK